MWESDHASALELRHKTFQSWTLCAKQATAPEQTITMLEPHDQTKDCPIFTKKTPHRSMILPLPKPFNLIHSLCPRKNMAIGQCSSPPPASTRYNALHHQPKSLPLSISFSTLLDQRYLQPPAGLDPTTPNHSSKQPTSPVHRSLVRSVPDTKMCYTQTPYHTVCGHYGKPTFTGGSPCIRAQTTKGYTKGCESTQNHVQSTASRCIACTREKANLLLPLSLSRNDSSSSLSSMASAASASSSVSAATLRSLKQETGSCGSWGFKGGEFFEPSSLHWRGHVGTADQRKTDNGSSMYAVQPKVLLGVMAWHGMAWYGRR
ncbi:uncharacterized protein MYCFIDRAFT_174706 [Pseudocercospora fijiensis CIRAD86]|uniref:Uncharacterized protein n=1 Tax=Pseudocercospora fijiensis (strain CIRAD86) TaxID=383855 RepID=M3B1K5_PSEFD|nr:uncharacterized protein MYCFIDRAFT_174706 [Pseudocercospora fijiensis CIRAD86]EME83233.1 hypothetical protein MYCFIDRAFT_174706 [Pseudocercospora fijiensis CIRAD86]